MAKYYWLVIGVAALAVHAGDVSAQDSDGGPGGGKDVTCTSTLGDTRVEGNLDVVGRCTLNGTEIRGDVTLFSGGSLTTRSARIRGNVDGSRADFIDFESSRVDGRVRLDGLVGDVSVIELTEIHGNVELTANRSRFEILNNDLNRDLQASFNIGGLLISGNAIGEDLTCILNVPAPVGTGNSVGGDAGGQCADLEASDPPPQPAPTPPPPEPTPPPAPTPTPTPTPTPAPSPPPTSSPPPATPPANDVVLDEGGAGAMGWLTLLLAPLVLVRRRLARR